MGTLKINGELNLHSYLTSTDTLYITSKQNSSIIFRNGTGEGSPAFSRFNPNGTLSIGGNYSGNDYKLYSFGPVYFKDTFFCIGAANFNSPVTIGNNDENTKMVISAKGSFSTIIVNTTSGWARAWSCAYEDANGTQTTFCAAGWNGTGSSFTKFYIGPAYNNCWFTINSAGKVAITNDLQVNKTITATESITAPSFIGNASTATTLSATLAVNKGGTGRNTLTAGYALLGNGTNAVELRAITSSITKDSNSLITSGGTALIDWVNPGKVIANGTDLDAYTVLGKSYISSESGAKTLLNCPTTSNFSLFTFGRTNSTTKALTQIIVDLTNQVFVRGSNSSGTWRDWSLLARASQLEKYLPLAGGKMTGLIEGNITGAGTLLSFKAWLSDYFDFDNPITFAREGQIVYGTHVEATDPGVFPCAETGGRAIMTISRAFSATNYISQFGFSDNHNLYYRSFGGSESLTDNNATKVWRKIYDDKTITEFETYTNEECCESRSEYMTVIVKKLGKFIQLNIYVSGYEGAPTNTEVEMARLKPEFIPSRTISTVGFNTDQSITDIERYLNLVRVCACHGDIHIWKQNQWNYFEATLTYFAV